MGLLTGQTVVEGDFVSTSSGASDEGKVPKLNASGKIPTEFLRFGGTGADGALTITSGATNIDLGSAQVVIKNYTSISITGTGSLTFTNPHANGTIIILKSQGNVTLTSSTAPMIDASGMGANTATAGHDYENVTTNYGGDGGYGNNSGGAGSTGNSYIFNKLLAKKINIFTGGGAGTGGTSGGTGGVGGRGGGGLYIECGGAWNFTTASGISVAGKNGANGVTAPSGGGGGGGGGSLLVLYNSLTANSGTVVFSGGTGGNGTGAGNTGGAGGNSLTGGTGAGSGGGNYASGGAGGGGGGASGWGTANGSGSTIMIVGTGQGYGGGGGGAGYYLIASNTEFV